MSRNLKFGAAVAAALAIGAVAAPAQADAIADFYKGKTVKIIFGFGVGGTYGKYSLTLAEFLAKHIPGNPKIIAQSMPGAGGLKAANYAYNVMAKDGTALYMPVETMIISELLRPNAVKFKSNKFTWLGTVVQTGSVIVVRSDAGINTLADLKKKEILLASSGKGSPTFLVPQTVNAVYGSKFKVIKGYRGARKMQLAMEQGEVQGVALTWLSWKSGKPHWFKGKKFARPIVQLGHKKEKDLPNVPMLRDHVKSDSDKQIVTFVSSLSSIGRGLALPPGAPQDKIVALRKAFAATVNDPAFRASAKKRSLRVTPLTGEQIQAIVETSLKASPAVVKRARKLIMGE